MQKLKYFCPWFLSKKTSWSGTHMSLFNALSCYYDVEDIDVGTRRLIPFLNQLKMKLFKIDPHLSNYKYENKIANKSLKKDDIVFQFTVSNYSDKYYSFLYVDLLFHFIKYIRETDKLASKYIGFTSVNGELLDKLLLDEKNFFNSPKSYIFTMSRCLRDFLINKKLIDEERVKYVGGGINIDIKKFDGSKRSGKRFLFVGKDFDRKNGPIVVEAFKKVKEKYNDVELFIIGPKEKHIENGINFLGRLTFSETTSYFNLCDYFVMPSLAEAYGLVFIEALSFGLPCIARNAFEMPYLIKDDINGYLLKDSFSTSELVSYMEKLLISDNIKNNVLKSRKEYIQEYNWDSAARRIKEKIDDITNK